MFIIVGCDDDNADPVPDPEFILSLEVNPNEAGVVTGAGSYPEGKQANITATSNESWVFLNWTGDTQFLDNANSANTFVTMPAQNISLTASFKKSEIIYGDGVTDIDGNEYVTVIIGDQEWMAKNLRVTNYNNGDDILTGLDDTAWSTTTSGAYAIYPHGSIPGLNSDEEVLEAYGALYNWFAVNDERGLCPEGWSVPGDADWAALVSYVVAQGYPNEPTNPNGAGNALKSCRQTDSPLGGACNTPDHPRWQSYGTHYGFDEFGFSALPAGNRNSYGGYVNVGLFGFWWSSSEHSATHAWGRSIFANYGNVNRDNGNKRAGFSLRCFRDIDN